MQTIYYGISNKDFESKDLYPATRVIVKLEDGGQISADYICCPKVDKILDNSTPIVVIFPGLTGNKRCGYVKVVIEEACQRNYKCVIINHRGCDHTPLTTRKFIIS